MSFICWCGSKKRLLPYINQIIEQYLANGSGDDITYVEPFLGSGVVLINILEKHPKKFKRFICADANEVLIKAFEQIKTNHQSLIKALESIQAHYQSLNKDEQKAFFYRARDLFNDIRLNRPVNKAELKEIISSDDNDLILSALFVFLNKTSYRGVYVINSKNQYKSSFGYISKAKIVKPALINQLHQLFNENNVEFRCCSYDELNLGDGKMLLYLDPPYLDTFDKYTSDGFDQDSFVKYLEVMTNKDSCRVILSNSKDFESVISNNDKINLLSINHITLRDFSNAKTPTQSRTEILASNIP